MKMINAKANAVVSRMQMQKYAKLHERSYVGRELASKFRAIDQKIPNNAMRRGELEPAYRAKRTWDGLSIDALKMAEMAKIRT